MFEPARSTRGSVLFGMAAGIYMRDYKAHVGIDRL